jgi:hypothetical protein
MQRWMCARCFEWLVEDTRILLREFAGRKGQRAAAVIDNHTLQFTPGNRARTGYDGAKWRKGSRSASQLPIKAIAHRLVVLAQEMRPVTGSTVKIAYLGYTGPHAAECAQSRGIRLEVIKHPLTNCCFVLCWVVERSFALAAHFRRLTQQGTTEHHHPQRIPLRVQATQLNFVTAFNQPSPFVDNGEDIHLSQSKF